MTKLLAALSLPQVGKIQITGDIEDTQGKGVIIQLELKDREYTLRALTTKEAQKWVDVLKSLRDGSNDSTSTTGGGSVSVSGSGSGSSNKKSIEVRSTSNSSTSNSTNNSKNKKSAPLDNVEVKDMSVTKTNKCCGFC